MIRKEVYVETGKSKATVSNDTYWAMAFGDKAATRAVKRALTNSSERTYTRKKTVWACKNCRAPDSNYVPPAPKRVATNVSNVDSLRAAVNTTNTPIVTNVSAVAKSRSILQKIIDRRPRSVLGWIVLVYAVAVILAMLDSG